MNWRARTGLNSVPILCILRRPPLIPSEYVRVYAQSSVPDLVIASGEMERNVIEPSLLNGTTEVVCADVRRWVDAALHSGDLTPPSRALNTHVERCAVCQGALLLLIAARTELPPSASRTPSQHCLDDLPAYIEQE